MTYQVSPHTHYAPLDDYGLIRVSGDDASSFLQGQFGNDLSLLDEARHQLNCYSSPKGRLLAVFRMYIHSGAYYLRMPREIVAATVARLKMFVLMAKVTVEDVGDTHASIGVSGPDAALIIAELIGDAPANSNETCNYGGLAILRVPGDGPRFEIHGEATELATIRQSLAESNTMADHNRWAYDEVLAGIPTIYTATREEFVAQMVNLQLIDGLSFKKGCYPGQEIVARMHYLGKLKRRMYAVDIAGDTPPAPGTEIFSSESDASVGKIVDARVTKDAPLRALAVITIAAAESATLHLGRPDGAALSIGELPYAFAAQD